MQVLEIKDKKNWNRFIGSQESSQFLQSWEWGQFQKVLGRKVWHLIVEDDNDILAAFLTVKRSLPFGKSYLYSPRGPLLKYEVGSRKYEEFFKILVKKITEIAKEENCIFYRFEPSNEIPDTGYEVNELLQTSHSPAQIFKENLDGQRLQTSSPVQPKDTQVLDLTKSENQLLAEMRQKTRYNIRLAERYGVKIRIMTYESRIKHIDKFLKLLHQTEKRDKFRPHPDEYYRKLVEQLSLSSKFQVPSSKKECFAKLYLAEYRDKIIAANIVIFFGDIATYAHGASSGQHRNVMAPHLLQWRQIQEAKKMGYKFYDFWGIGPQWPGLTRFKKGFGGREINYLGTFDLIFQPFWYRLYNFFRKTKKLP